MQIHSLFNLQFQFFKGDQGYATSRELVSPVRQPRGVNMVQQKNFNKALSKTRLVVERAIGRVNSHYLGN
jgi:hypothetical protein